MNRATTIRLERVEDGAWRATQPDVELVGRGATAARAAANYCELVAETGGSPGT
ncbi:hypothetical protein [Natronoarchaeum mannanilyticum]|uniref:HicB family protein n=1 Tax=Natronoarchaeum mannanilyticum TaxID=926360 RepID=A0AAV3T9A4_9EURY